MPEIFSRMDNVGWLTPAIADVLEQGAAPPGGDGSIRAQIAELQQALAEQGTPARIVNVRPAPSYTLYSAQLGGGRRASAEDLRRSLARIDEQRQDWKLGFVPQLQNDENSLGILLRTDDHKPLGLRRLLVRTAYRDHPSSYALALGVTLEQELVVRDLASSGHLLIVGSDAAKQNAVRSLLLTLMLLNTPVEMRLALVGESSQAYRSLIDAPHSLGRLIISPDEGQRLFDGLVKESQRRQQWFSERNARSLESYNNILRNQGEVQLSRIVLLLDSLSDASWQAKRDSWSPALKELLVNGSAVGIHLILAADELDAPHVPDALVNELTTQLILRSQAMPFVEQLKGFHKSALRFVDAFLVEMSANVTEITPLEMCAVPEEEMKRAVSYWRQVANQRAEDRQTTQVGGRTGVTGVLRVPVQTAEAQAAAPEARPTTATDEERTLKQAQALASYLGWLGPGPLQDVLGLSTKEAQAILKTLQANGVIAEGDGPKLIYLGAS